jgi:hypothetical protein
VAVLVFAGGVFAFVVRDPPPRAERLHFIPQDAVTD